MAHPWVDESLAVYPGTVKEGYLVKSPPLDGKGVKLKVLCAAATRVFYDYDLYHCTAAVAAEMVCVHQPWQRASLLPLLH